MRAGAWRSTAFSTASARDALTVEVAPELAVTDQAHRRQLGMQIAASAQRPHLVEQALAQHGVKALRDAHAQAPHGRPAQARAGGVRVASRRAGPRRAARKAAGPSARSLRARAGCAGDRSVGSGAAAAGSSRASSACSAGQPVPRRALLDPLPDRRVGGRQARETGLQRPEVQHRAADKERRAPAGTDRFRCRVGVGEKSRGRVALERVDQVDQVMRRARAAVRATASPCRCPCRDRPWRHRR